jgi:hypothetical protein
VGFLGVWFLIFGFSWTRVKCGFRGLLICSLWILVDKGKLWVSYLAFVGNLFLVFPFLEAN